jgi:hypothetical protein
MRFGAPPPSLDFRGGTTFDRKIQDAIEPRSQTYRTTSDVIGGIGFGGAMAYRGFEDLVMAGAVRGGWDVAWQMMVIDSIAFGMVASVVWGLQVGVGRERPRHLFCRTDEGYRQDFPDCNPGGSNRSFISGHLATAVTGAALTCVHHRHLGIYEPGGAKAACGIATGMAALTSVARGTSGWHWTTDLIMGAGLGVVAGWLVPRLLHYGFDRPALGSATRENATEGEGDGSASVKLMVAPQLGRQRGALKLVGVF